MTYSECSRCGQIQRDTRLNADKLCERCLDSDFAFILRNAIQAIAQATTIEAAREIANKTLDDIRQLEA